MTGSQKLACNRTVPLLKFQVGKSRGSRAPLVKKIKLGVDLGPLYNPTKNQENPTLSESASAH
jgi:hypothetical protein